MPDHSPSPHSMMRCPQIHTPHGPATVHLSLTWTRMALGRLNTRLTGPYQLGLPLGLKPAPASCAHQACVSQPRRHRQARLLPHAPVALHVACCHPEGKAGGRIAPLAHSTKPHLVRWAACCHLFISCWRGVWHGICSRHAAYGIWVPGLLRIQNDPDLASHPCTQTSSVCQQTGSRNGQPGPGQGGSRAVGSKLAPARACGAPAHRVERTELESTHLDCGVAALC